MMKAAKKLFLTTILVLSSTQVLCMICDSRYFPFFPVIHTRIEGKESWFSFNPFFTRADSAYDWNENEIPIPALWKEYNQKKLSLALDLVGLPDPFPAPFKGTNPIWAIEQKIHAQGLAFTFEKHLFEPLAIGFSWLFMHVNSRQCFCLKDRHDFQLEGHLEELEDARLAMHRSLGICEAYSSRGGMGDFDCYLRVGKIWDYPYRLRRLDAGVTLGLLLPAGKERDINSPSTVPFGGDGHWGVYGRADAELELKEDLKVGFIGRLGKRFQKTRCMRLPVAGEHPMFGALIAPVSVSPGVNAMFTAYGSVENLRAGLGLRVGLNLSMQERPSWCDMRSTADKKSLPVMFSDEGCRIEDQNRQDFYRLSDIDGWKSDYIFVNVFYDFGKTAPERGYKPVLTFSWDFPYCFWASEYNIRTHRISLGIEVNF